MDSSKRTVRIFISYAHDDQDYFMVFKREFDQHLRNSKRYNFVNFDDTNLLIGSDWDKKLKLEIAVSNLGYLLLSPAFLNSQYVKEIELKEMLEKAKSKDDFILCPIYFRSFVKEPNFIDQYQFFKVNGSKYGKADKGQRFVLCTFS